VHRKGGLAVTGREKALKSHYRNWRKKKFNRRKKRDSDWGVGGEGRGGEEYGWSEGTEKHLRQWDRHKKAGIENELKNKSKNWRTGRRRIC